MSLVQKKETEIGDIFLFKSILTRAWNEGIGSLCISAKSVGQLLFDLPSLF